MAFFLRNKIPRTKDGIYVINLHDKNSKFIDRNIIVYFDSFGTEYISQEVLNKIKDKSDTHNRGGVGVAADCRISKFAWRRTQIFIKQ